MNQLRAKIKDFGTITTGKTPSTDKPEYYEGDYPFITPSDYDHKSFYCRKTERTVTDVAKSKHINQFVSPNSVLVTCIGATIGKTCLSPRVALTNQQINSITTNDSYDFKYIYYLMIHNYDVIRAIGLGGGAATPLLNKTTFENIELKVHKLSDQRKIGRFLFYFDELIEKNKQQVALLEESARLIYKEWFVHFRFPGYEKVKVVNGVPDGWKNQSLSEFIDVTHGYAFKGEFFVDEITKFVLTTPGNIKVGAGFKSDKFKYYSTEGPVDEKYIFQPKDIFVGMTDLSKTSDTLGYPAFVPYSEDEVYLHNQRLGRVISKLDYFPRYFIFQLLTDFRYRHHVVGAATGTSVKHTSPTRILSYKQYLPPMSKASLIGKFDELVEPIYLQILNFELQNKKLTSARDLLLPRLMNGDIKL